MTNHENDEIESLGFARLLGTFENQSPEWHQARRGIGGSDIGVIMGRSPWKSPYTLWAEKTGQIDDTIEPTIQMELGTVFEKPIRDLWAKRNAEFLTVSETGTWQSIANPTWKANPDGIIRYRNGELAILEIKHTASYWDALPEMYEYQVMWYLHILGLRTGIVVAVSGGYLREFNVEYDAERMATVEARVRAFQGYVAGGIAPDYDGSNSTYETVRKISPALIDGEIELGAIYEALITSKTEADAAAERFQANKSMALAYMGGVRIGTFNGEKVITLQARNNNPFITFN
jgi:putative phage-type endonuclease